MNLLQRFIKFYQIQDSILFWSTAISVLSALFLTIFYLFYFDTLPRQIPLFYSLPWGDTQFAEKSQFIILPALIMLAAMVNLIITWHLHKSQLTMKRIILFSTTVIALIAVVAGVRIILTMI